MPAIRDKVRLCFDLPELNLYEGDVGIVREAWYFPNVAFEVEFPCGSDVPQVLLLLGEQVTRLAA